MGVPAGSFQRPIYGVVKIVPVAGTIRRVAYAAVPAVPAGAHVAIRVEQVPVMVDRQPFVCRVSAVCVPVPPAARGLDPADPGLLRLPGAHELGRVGVQLLDARCAAAPVRELEVGLVHDGLPVASPFQAQGCADGSGPAEEVAGFVVGTGAVVAVDVESRAPLVVGAVAAAGGIGDDIARLGAALGVQGVLLCYGAQGFAYGDLKALAAAFCHEL